MNSVALNGLEMFYVEHGTGNPLILLHGGSATASENWSEYFPTLSSKYHVISPDLRGHGQTRNPSGEWSYRVMADDIVALISELDIRKPNICGWSDGGQIALELAMRYPGLANKYIAGGSTGKFSESYFQHLGQWGFKGPGIVDFKQIQTLTPDFVEGVQKLHAVQGRDYWKDLLVGISHAWLTPLNYKNEDFQKISDPMLIVCGDRDQFIPLEESVSLYRHIPKSALTVVPNADHTLPRINVDELIEIVLKFL